MLALGDIIVQELGNPTGRSVRERLLEAMFMMERFRCVDAGWRDVVPHVGEADVGADSIRRLANALRTFIVFHRDHPDIGSAIWALAALRADEDATLFEAVLRDESEYGSFAREQAQRALEVIRP
jgi:hypothetical protein